MAIVYTDKGHYMHKHLRNINLPIEQVDGVWVAKGSDVATQAVIDSYDPVPDAKLAAIARIKEEGAKRVATVYPFIAPDGPDAAALYNFAEDLYLSILSAARTTLRPRLRALQGIFNAAVAAISSVNSMTDVASIDSYDEVNTPAWP